ncbi:FAD-dependent oxidoreductase-like enzyme [Pyrenophora seminiperda CCB06]|uniref:FAD-dependent oxidoreductase-like enzyme n=1 Tax=Pyrenophora seminiperda CCB06 TaxID=1302712 RepID=A0A3M7MAA1_9PLEO|nr:FAD-dependent oxidoreductase-like enzyme [Pyrenophora seminiperda CCB06]
MESHAPPQYQPSQESLIPTTEYAPPETPKLRSPSPAESAAALAMSKLASPDHVKFISPAPRTTSSMTPPPSSQIPGTRAVMRTPTPSTPQLTSPPPTSKLPDQPSALTDMGAGLYPQDQVNAASAEELRSMVNSLSNALRDMRLSAAHYKLQYNMAVMESQEAASRMAVELAMAQRELDVLQQAEEKRKSTISAPEQNYQESAHAANAMMLSEMSRQNQILQSENEELRDVLEQQKRLTEHREGELASVLDENDRLKTRIRKNRDHIAPLLEQIEHSSPRSNFGTPIQPPPRSRIGRLPAPLSQESRSQNNFEALLLADKMLSQEVATAPSTPNRIHAPKSRFGHQRGAQSLSSIPQPPNRRVAYPRAQVPRTPPAYVPTSIPQSAPPAHYQYQQKPSNIRRQSSNSTITASSMDDEEAFTDREEDEVPESQASQMARNLLQRPPPAKGMMSAPAPQSNLIQSKIFGQVKKGHGLGRPGELKRGRMPSTADLATSPPKRGRVDQGVGLGIGGLLRE